MCAYIPNTQPRRQWVQYDDGSYEPVNPRENINRKPRGPNQPDWWVVTQEPEWRPTRFANTKRGRKAERELGTAPQTRRSEASARGRGTAGPGQSQGQPVPSRGGTTPGAEGKNTPLPPRPEDNDQFERPIVEVFPCLITSPFMAHHGRNKMRERLHKEKEQYTDENDWAMRAGLDQKAKDYTRWGSFFDTYLYRNNDRAFAAMRDKAKKKVVPPGWGKTKKDSK